MKKVIEISLVSIAILTIIYGSFLIRSELRLAGERIKIINNLTEQNDSLRKENDTLNQRLDTYFKHDSNPLEDSTEKGIKIKDAWQKIVENSEAVSQIEYTEQFACFDFSKDLKRLLDKERIPSKMDIVKMKSGFHAILSIQIEPQTGEIVYYNTDNLVDQCYEAENGQYYCRNGKIMNDINMVERYNITK